LSWPEPGFREVSRLDFPLPGQASPNLIQGPNSIPHVVDVWIAVDGCEEDGHGLGVPRAPRRSCDTGSRAVFYRTLMVRLSIRSSTPDIERPFGFISWVCSRMAMPVLSYDFAFKTSGYRSRRTRLAQWYPTKAHVPCCEQHTESSMNAVACQLSSQSANDMRSARLLSQFGPGRKWSLSTHPVVMTMSSSI
jgi:hypothetical protein